MLNRTQLARTVARTILAANVVLAGCSTPPADLD
jgi:hypothetical protein